MSYRVPVLETYSWQKPIESISNDPPISPHKANRFIVGSTPTGDWVGKTNSIAWFDGVAWKFDVPTEGWFTRDLNAHQFIYFDGTSWGLLEADQIKIDNSQFTQFPNNTVMTLQDLVTWMDGHLNTSAVTVLGTPIDGTFTDGLLDWTPETRMTEAFDNVNEILKDLAPAQANTLAGTTLSNNRTTYAGRLPAGLSSDWYSDVVAGADITGVIVQSSLELSTPSTSDTFRSGDMGYLIGKKKDGSGTFADYAKLNIAANFSETARSGSQDLTTWDFKDSTSYPCSTCDTPVDGVVTKTNATLNVLNVAKYNNFSMWQKMNAKMTFTSLAEGYHQYQMVHNVNGSDRATNVVKTYYDDSSAIPLAVNSLSIVEKVAVLRWLSGIPYYDVASTFDVSFSATGLYQKIYRPDLVADYKLSNSLSATTSLAQNTTPNYTDALNVAGVLTLTGTNVTQLDVRAQVQLYHPYKVLGLQSSSAQGRRAHTFSSTRSTDLIEYWTDEQYRLPLSFNTDAIPSGSSAIKNQWISSNALGSNDALQYNSTLQYGNVNLSGGLPTGGRDYSSKSGTQRYLRCFNIGSPHAGMTIQLTGLVLADVGAVGSGAVNVEIKLPGQTGWCDAGSDFNANTFDNPAQPKDGQGCRVSVSGSLWTLTFGGKNTVNTNGYVFVRITFNNSTKTINGTVTVSGT